MTENPPHHRHAERAEFRNLFLAGRSVILLAPRRIGKTWLMDKILEDMTQDKWRCIKVDIGGKANEHGFLQALCAEIGKTRSISESILTRLKHTFQLATDGKSAPQGGDLTSNLLDIVKATDHRRFLEALVEGLANDEGRTLIMIDEFAYLILRMAETSPELADSAKDMLYHLRKLQLANPKVQWFLTGSIGLDVVTERFGFGGAFVDYDIRGLSPFTTEETRSYMHSLEAQPHPDKQFELSDSALDHLTKELGWLAPYYLRQIAGRIKPTGDALTDKQKRIATTVDVESAIADLLKPEGKTHFSPWEEHIKKNFAVEDRLVAFALLKQLCAESEGDGLPTLLAQAMATQANTTERQVKNVLINLEKDGFLSRSDGRWTFRSGIVRRYWKEYVA